VGGRKEKRGRGERRKEKKNIRRKVEQGRSSKLIFGQSGRGR
jgi:hypothetical protein